MLGMKKENKKVEPGLTFAETKATSSCRVLLWLITVRYTTVRARADGL